MTTVTTIVRDEPLGPTLRDGAAGTTGAISWPAIFAGATTSAALSLILLVLGIGLGLSVVSPWSGTGPTTEAMSWSTIGWISFTAFAASGLGGYIAGRLRTRWPDTQQDEVYFRDTAHGFLAWAVATLLTAAVFTTVIGGLLGTPAGAAAASTAGAEAGALAQQLTEEARRNAAIASLWIFVSLLIGAFSASWLATFGGRQRDLP